MEEKIKNITFEVYEELIKLELFLLIEDILD